MNTNRNPGGITGKSVGRCNAGEEAARLSNSVEPKNSTINPQLPFKRRGNSSVAITHLQCPSFGNPAGPCHRIGSGQVLNVGKNWRKALLQYSLTPLLLLLPIIAQAKLNVVATLPDFGSLAREIGGDFVTVSVMAKPTEDPHFVDARPSFVVQLRSADVLIEGGAELEMGWLPPLLQNSRNPKIEVGKPGRVVASEGIRLMNVPASVTRATPVMCASMAIRIS